MTMDQLWTELPMTAFDLETTGANPTECRIVTASIVDIDVRSGASDVTEHAWLLDPEIEIPEEATKVHGITTEKARADGQNYYECFAAIRDKLIEAWAAGRIVVIFNANFDLTVIAREGTRLGFPDLDVGPVVDPFTIDRALDKYRKGSRKLDATCVHYGVRLDDAHSASGDAFAAARLAWRLPRRYPRLAQMTVDELMAAQTDWYRERQLDFIAYRKRIGESTDDIETVWPVRSAA